MVSIINQPSEVRLGDKIIETLAGDDFDNLYFIVAFAKKSGVSRIQDAMRTFVENGGNIDGVVGIDSKGTSVEGLTLLLELTNNLYIYHDENNSQSFHPKIYIFEKEGIGAKIWIGSSNLTAGGLYTNYEVDLELDFDLEYDRDIELFRDFKKIFENYTNIDDNCCKLLNGELLEQLIEDNRLIDTEARINSRASDGGGRTTEEIRVSFGTNPFRPASLPQRTISEGTILPEFSEDSIPHIDTSVEGVEFYMHLNTLQTSSTPGEARIPLSARKLAEHFFGWPEKYVTESRDSGKKIRKYREWKPEWEIIDSASSSMKYYENVRIYEYEDSKDFRFYSSYLVALGADGLDIVKITRIPTEQRGVFKCELAKKGTSVYEIWKMLLTKNVPNSPRKFGFIGI